MTDAQITIAITVLAVLAGWLFNNVRISDLNGRFVDTNRRIDDAKEVLRAESRALEARMDNRFDRIDRKLDELLRISAGHEGRIVRLEQR